MAAEWPKTPRLIGGKLPRLDGVLKSTGRAKYTLDINRPKMLHGVILRSPHAHARIKSLDLAAAEKMPGVKGTLVITAAGKEVYYAGDEIVALAAETEEQALDAMRAIKIEYELLDFFVDEADALASKKNTVGGKAATNVSKPQTFAKGDVAEAYKTADAVVEGSYGASTICHQCLEPHGVVAEWDAEGNLTLYASTQAVFGIAGQLATKYELAPGKVKVITHHMGGGYGSKFNAGPEGEAAVELAKLTKRPVKMMLDRADEITVGGNRPSAFGKVKIAGKKDGTITAFEVTSYGTPGFKGGATVNVGLFPYVYLDAIDNIKRENTVAFTNAGPARAMRAPGHPQNCIITEFAVEDLAAKLGIDPLVIRRKNLPPNVEAAKIEKKDRNDWLSRRNTIYNEQLDIITKLCDWKAKWHEPGKGPKKGPWLHGIGMALHTWGGFASAGENDTTVKIASNGAVTAETSTQDLGTGQRTVTCLITAEILGLMPEDITLKIGESSFGKSTGSGGSTTLPSQAPAALRAATAAKEDLFKRVAAKLKIDPTKLEISVGKVIDTANKKEWAWKEFCAKLGMEEAKGVGEWTAALSIDDAVPKLSSGQVGGVQVAEVLVDIETGVVKCTNMWAVQDCGLLINVLACESQVAGGVIMGVNYALFEERIMDRHTGRQTNADMEFYKLGGIEDMPKIHVHMQNMPERGVIGIGEPPTISTAAAIGNAIFNAIGARVPVAPFTADRVLAALDKKGAKG
ncbi:MAG: xanthine dehydrogenase family protein molybdopterin-binding subunit [Planctomycetes bacterium]|nr:xanthine dehydrogenase family protein molybdopterin-binding subunit [Planctomycetota bacterium]